MPDAHNNFKGQGWSRARAAGWERVFGTPAAPAEAHVFDCPADWGDACERCTPNRDNPTPGL